MIKKGTILICIENYGLREIKQNALYVLQHTMWGRGDITVINNEAGVEMAYPFEHFRIILEAEWISHEKVL